MEEAGRFPENSPMKELEDLINAIVTSGESTLDASKIKILKKMCKNSNDLLRHAFHLLRLQLRVEHAEARYSAFLIISELFVRSHLFRTLLLDHFQEYMDQTMETDFDNPLPPPKAVAEKLKSESLTAVKVWNSTYGTAYRKLQLGFDFLKSVKKINFNQPRPVPEQTQLVAEQQLSRSKIVAGQRLDKLEKDMEKTLWEVVNCSVEITNCLDLLVPCFGNATESSNASEESNSTKSLRETGLIERDYKIELDLSEVSAVKVKQTTDNDSIIERAKDCHKSASRIYLPRLKRWLATAVKYGASPGRIKQLIDVKVDLEKTVEKYREVQLLKESSLANVANDDSDSDCDDFEEVPTAHTFAEPLPILTQNVNSATSKKKATKKKMVTVVKENPILSKHGDTNVWTPLRPDVSADDPTSYQHALMQAKKRKNLDKVNNKSPHKKPLIKIIPKSKSSGTSKDGKESLLEKAPVVPFGRDLLVWDKEKMDELRQTVKMGSAQEYDVGHRFWTGSSASEGDNGISDAALNSITSRAIEFAGEFTPVTRSCKAPLANGKLCPRQDRYKCPFHGKIIDRDACGNPVGAQKDQPSTSATVADNGWQDFDFLRDLQSNLPGNVDLSVKKGKKKEQNGLSDLNAIKHTSRSRLQKKVLNPSSLKRVSEKLDVLDTKRNFDKFGNNFNYALN